MFHHKNTCDLDQTIDISKKSKYLFTLLKTEKKLGDIYFEQTWILELSREIRKNFEIKFKNFQVKSFHEKYISTSDYLLYTTKEIE